MNDNNQYMVQVGDFDQNAYIIQEGNALPVQYDGNTLINNEMHDGSNIVSEPRWIQNSSRGGKVISNNQSFINGDIVTVSGTNLNINTRYTPSSIVLNTSAGGQFDQDNMRISSAVTGSGARGRPRGRKPSRGNFPVVPIDMVRQLGIEQQVILQPTVPVAMKNKSIQAKPIMHSKIQYCADSESNMGTSATNTESTLKYVYKPVFIPVPTPVYIPVPVFIKEKSQKVNNTLALSNVEHTSVEGDSIFVESNNVAQTNIDADNRTSELRKRKLSETEENPTKIRKVDAIEVKDNEMKLKIKYGMNAWTHWSPQKSLLDLVENEEILSNELAKFVQNVRKPNDEPYNPDSIMYLALSIQLFLLKNGHNFKLFTDPKFIAFQNELNKQLATFYPKLNDENFLLCRIEEEHLWESKQLGVHDTGILVLSFCYLLTKYLKIKDYKILMKTKAQQIVVDNDKVLFIDEMGESTVICQNDDQNSRYYDILTTYMHKRTTLSNGPEELILFAQDDDNLKSIPVSDTEMERMYNIIRIVKEIQENLV